MSAAPDLADIDAVAVEALALLRGPLADALAWAVRGMLLRRSAPDDARAFGAAWTAEADRWTGAARCITRGERAERPRRPHATHQPRLHVRVSPRLRRETAAL